LTGENSFASQQVFRRSAAISPMGEFFAGQQFCQSTAFSLAGEFFATRRLAGEFSTVGSVFASRLLFRRLASFSPFNSFASRQGFRRLAAFSPVGSFSPASKFFAGWQLFCHSADVLPVGSCFAGLQIFLPETDSDAMATNNGIL
jgi:hypothetical protein